MLKVNNKDNRTKSLTSFRCYLFLVFLFLTLYFFLCMFAGLLFLKNHTLKRGERHYEIEMNGANVIPIYQREGCKITVFIIKFTKTFMMITIKMIMKIRWWRIVLRHKQKLSFLFLAESTANSIRHPTWRTLYLGIEPSTMEWRSTTFTCHMSALIENSPS